ncbi:Flagellar radial spoke protein [Tritrichomonas foetus]|uniref:Flagellar radial spoke protein n=1 Tax=Tritrichomonas foetus TaxID=1144522 RepID=A0A1J4JPK4_9EUKA|nr:Flagellar radial spoke protein [Tritrichomonas foetus]|eukprot:OHT01065.1 Flagellar radial spoke protein [Tritrichomonas foetus]
MQLFPKQKLTAEGEEEEEDQPEGDGNEDGEGAEDTKHEEEEAANEGEVPNTLSDLRFLSQVGVGLTDREANLLQQSIQKLVRSKPIATAHFWGKVMGVDRDYYIVEVEFNDGERPHGNENGEEEEKNEEGGEAEKDQRPPLEEDTGPNLKNYFVSTALGGKWTLLPDIKPDQIVASRSIKQMFTGNLNAPVLAPPGRFEGTEKELLRAFIARVVHSCSLAPKGLYNAEETEEEQLDSNAPIEMEEEWVPKPIKGMESFVHRTAYILPQGRVDFWAPEAEEEDENEQKVEKGPPILRPITLDEPIEGNVPSWSMRTVNSPASPRKHYWLRSNTWPGLNILSTDNGDRLVMLYFGWGMKATTPLEWPPLPEPKKKPKPVEEEEEEEQAEKNDEEEEQQGEQTDEQKQDPESTESGTYDYSSA